VRTSPASRNVRRCPEIVGWLTPKYSVKMTSGVNELVLEMADLTAAERFYTEVLGFLVSAPRAISEGVYGL
jgi:hypothetical protein